MDRIGRRLGSLSAGLGAPPCLWGTAKRRRGAPFSACGRGLPSWSFQEGSKAGREAELEAGKWGLPRKKGASKRPLWGAGVSPSCAERGQCPEVSGSLLLSLVRGTALGDPPHGTACRQASCRACRGEGQGCSLVVLGGLRELWPCGLPGCGPVSRPWWQRRLMWSAVHV